MEAFFSLYSNLFLLKIVLVEYLNGNMLRHFFPFHAVFIQFHSELQQQKWLPGYADASGFDSGRLLEDDLRERLSYYCVVDIT